MKTTRAISVALAAALQLMLLTGISAAEPAGTNKREAAEHFQRGLSLYTDGDYHGALVEFRRAYAISPAPSVLYNIGQTLLQLRDYAGALEPLQRYLDTAGPEGEFRKLAEESLETVKKRVGRLQITVSVAEATVSVDDRPVGVSPLKEPLTVSMGRRRVSASLGGRTVTRRVDVAAGETVAVDLDLPAAHEAPAPAPAPEHRRGTIWTPVAWGAFGVLGAGAIVTGVLALKTSSDLGDKRDTLGSSRQDLDSGANNTRALALTTDILIGAAAVAGGVALYLTLTGGRGKAEERPKNQAWIELLPGGARVAGTF